MKVRSITLSLVVVFIAQISWSADESVSTNKQVLTIDDCVQIGLKQSGTALNATRDELIANERVRQARSQALPRLSLSSQYLRLDELQKITFGDSTIEMGTIDSYSVETRIEQLLFNGGKVNAALRAARLSKDYAQLNKKETEARLIKDIKTGFNRILLARSAVEVMESSVKQLQSYMQQTEEKKANGKASEFELITAKVRYMNEKPELIRASNNCELATESFCRLIGVDSSDYEFKGKLEYKKVPLKGIDELTKEALLQRPACKAMEDLHKLNEEDYTAAKAGLWPSLSAFGIYNGANSYKFVSYGSQWEWHWSAGLAVQWNIWDGDLTRGVIKQKKLEMEKARTDVDEMKKNVSLAIRQAYLELGRSEDTVTASEDNISLAEKAMKIAEVRYQSGLGTYLEFTDANLALRKAQLSYLNAVCDHLNAQAQLEYAAGIEAPLKQEK